MTLADGTEIKMQCACWGTGLLPLKPGRDLWLERCVTLGCPGRAHFVRVIEEMRARIASAYSIPRVILFGERSPSASFDVP